jgi:hypothetical protein
MYGLCAKGMVFLAFPVKQFMQQDPKDIHPFSDPDKRPESDRTSDSYLGNNPGLKDEKAVKQKDLLNEDPLEEKEAIERTSEDRLDEAE